MSSLVQIKNASFSLLSFLSSTLKVRISKTILFFASRLRRIEMMYHCQPLKSSSSIKGARFVLAETLSVICDREYNIINKFPSRLTPFLSHLWPHHVVVIIYQHKEAPFSFATLLSTRFISIRSTAVPSSCNMNRSAADSHGHFTLFFYFFSSLSLPG